MVTNKKPIYGVGINDADYTVAIIRKVDGKQKTVWRCPFYCKWISMLRRCYSDKYHARRPTYSAAEVCEEWKLFSNFKSWMQSQDYEGKELDKDILVPNNKIYSPDMCIFVSQKVNSFLTESNALRGKLPIGVYTNAESSKFRAQCWSLVTGKRTALGTFNSAAAAHQAWLSFKLEQAIFLAQQQTDDRVAIALISRYENYDLLFPVNELSHD